METEKTGSGGVAVHRGDPSSLARSIAERLYRARGDRARHLGDDLFADPAWDMLLDLFVCEGRRCLSVTAVTAAARAPHATATRYLKLLAARGLIERVRDPADARRTHVRLSPLAVAAMESVLVRYERAR